MVIQLFGGRKEVGDLSSSGVATNPISKLLINDHHHHLLLLLQLALTRSGTGSGGGGSRWEGRVGEGGRAGRGALVAANGLGPNDARQREPAGHTIDVCRLRAHNARIGGLYRPFWGHFLGVEAVIVSGF